jgi:hypothetical protein
MQPTRASKHMDKTSDTSKEQYSDDYARELYLEITAGLIFILILLFGVLRSFQPAANQLKSLNVVLKDKPRLVRYRDSSGRAIVIREKIVVSTQEYDAAFIIWGLVFESANVEDLLSILNAGDTIEILMAQRDALRLTGLMRKNAGEEYQIRGLSKDSKLFVDQTRLRILEHDDKSYTIVGAAAILIFLIYKVKKAHNANYEQIFQLIVSVVSIGTLVGWILIRFF